MFIVRHPWLTALAVFLLVCLGCCLIPVWIVGSLVSAKSSAPRSFDTPSPRRGNAQPIPQLENHTCGLLALSAAYHLYGLSPESKNLRYRLGVDVLANPLDSDSQGTLHPDLLRVLVQDGFAYEMPSPIPDSGVDALRQHLESGEVALLLIRRRETGGLHWVLADDGAEGFLRIVDSLRPGPTREPLGRYADECILSMILIRPGPSGGGPEVRDAHADGAAEMLRIKDRLDRLMQRDR